MSKKMAFPSVSPESLGIPSDAIEKYLDHIRDNKLDMNSLMIVRHGRMAASGWWAPYSADRLHAAHSLSKSITSAAIGLMIKEGKVGLQDRVIDLFPDDLPKVLPDNLDKMTLWHLLTMTCGHETEPIAGPEKNYPKVFLSHPIPHEPGTRYLYNTMASYMLCLLIFQRTGQNLLDYLRPRVLDPIGIKHIFCLKSPRGIEHGGMGVYITTEDIARLSQLYLDKGRYDRVQLIPEEWIDESTAWQVPTPDHPAGDGDHTSGFGYHVWRCIPDNVYRFAGANGQFGIVMPDKDAVIAITASSWDTAGITEGIWDILLPAMRDEPLPKNTAGVNRLRKRMESLAIDWPAGRSDPEMSVWMDGRRIVWQDNTFSFSFERNTQSEGVTATTFVFDGVSAELNYEEGTASGCIRLGLDGTKLESVQHFGGHAFPVLATGAHTSDGSFRIDMRSIMNTAHRTLFLSPEGNGESVNIRIEQYPNTPGLDHPQAVVLSGCFGMESNE